MPTSPTAMPVFPILGKDALAPDAVARYRDLCNAHGLHGQALQVQAAIDEIVAWQQANPDLLKLPDHTHVPADAQPGVFSSYRAAVATLRAAAQTCTNQAAYYQGRAQSGFAAPEVITEYTGEQQRHTQAARMYTGAADYLDHLNVVDEATWEAFCHRCTRPNIGWSAPSPLWNQVMRGGDINGEEPFDGVVCPVCFAQLAQEQGVADMWTLAADRVYVKMQTVTPSGRRWDPATGRWTDPPQSVDVKVSWPSRAEAIAQLRDAAAYATNLAAYWRAPGSGIRTDDERTDAATAADQQDQLARAYTEAADYLRDITTDTAPPAVAEPDAAPLAAQLQMAMGELNRVAPVLTAALALAALTGTDTDPADATNQVLEAAAGYLQQGPRLTLFEWGPTTDPIHPAWTYEVQPPPAP